jgi:hypothetical protein
MHPNLLFFTPFYINLLALKQFIVFNALLDHPDVWKAAWVAEFDMFLGHSQILPRLYIFVEAYVGEDCCWTSCCTCGAVNKYILTLDNN